MDATKLEILDKFKEDDSEIAELSRIEESELLQSPRFKRFQSSSSSSPRSPASSTPSSPSKNHTNENNTVAFDSIPKLRYNGSNPFLRTPSKRRIPLKPSNRQTPLKFTPMIPSTIQNDYMKSSVSLTPAQRVEKKPGKLLTTSDILSSYEFKETIGRGAFANVYRAINKVTGDEVAIKEIFIEDDDNILELMQEIDLLKILKHKNIVKYHGFIRNEKKMLIFLEYCSGGSLRHLYKKKGPLKESQVIELLKQVITGLIYLHQQGVVHRDVKAANILLTNDGNVKLTDFGVSTQVSSNTIKTFSIAGTPNWMAPEIISMDGTSSASDIWSLGATVVELLTGEPLYSHLNEMAALHAIVTDDHPPIPEFISPLCKDFLMKCFEKQPKLRFTAEELSKHQWLNEDIYKETIANSTKKIVSTLKLDEYIERDFNSIKRFNTKNFLPMATGTFKNDRFDELISSELTLKLDELNINYESPKIAKMFSPTIINKEEEAENLIEKVKRKPTLIQNISNLLDFFIKNPKEIDNSVSETMVFNVLHWIELNQSRHEIMLQYLKLLHKFVDVDGCSVVDLGGLPQLSKYLHKKYPSSIREITVDILNSVFIDDLNLKTFIQCGGLKSSLYLLEEDYKKEKKLLTFAVSLLIRSLKSDKFSKSIVILIVSSHKNFLDWLAVVLLQFMNFQDLKSSDQLISIISELKSSKLFEIKPIFLNSIFKVFEKLSLKNQVTIIDFLKNVDVIKFQENLEFLKFMVKIIKNSISSNQTENINAFKNKLLNMSCSIIFSICHLDEKNQIELVKMDVIPSFKKILNLNLTSSEFVIPLLCEFSFNSQTVPIVLQEDVLEDYINLLRDPIWQANVMDSLAHLKEKINDDRIPNLLLTDPDRSLITAVLTECGLNYELFLEKLLKLLNFYNKSISVNQIRLLLFQNNLIINTTFNKITDQYKTDTSIQIQLFKLLKVLIVNNYHHPNYEKIIEFTKKFKNSKTLLIDRLVEEILELANSKSMMPPPPITSLNRIKAP